jgi:hypothetical protein
MAASYGSTGESRGSRGTLQVSPLRGDFGADQVPTTANHLALFAAVLSIAAAAAPPALFAAEPRVNLEIATAPDFPPTEIRKWSELLGKLELGSVRIRGGNGNDAAEIKVLGKEDSPTYQVIGILTDEGKLLLPKGRFGLSDRAKLEQWFAKLKAGGIEGSHRQAGGVWPFADAACHGA